MSPVSSALSVAAQPLRILMLEDNPYDTQLTLMQLTRAGLEVEWKRIDTREAFIADLETGHWELVLADYSMPQFSAADALRILRERKIDLPFIIISGSVGEDIAVVAMKSGAHDFFVKGQLTRLAAAVERELREAQARAAGRKAMEELRRSQEAHRLAIEKLVDELRDAVRARDEFLSIASHELKTPITSLRLQLEMLGRLAVRNTAASPTLQHKVDSALRQSDRLTSLINGLLDVMRITQGRLSLTRERVDLQTLARDVVSRSEDAIRRSGSLVELQAPESVAGQWDALRLDTVLTNLLDNAVKYGGGKPIEIAVEKHPGLARLVVKDHGIGIPAQEQARIFQRFERAVTESHYGGLGLGLWVVRQVVDAHGGTVAVASREGEGSTFTVDLPLDPPQ